MLRISLIAAAFLSVTIALIAMQPSMQPPTETGDTSTPEVTRAQGNLEGMTDVAAVGAATQMIEDNLQTTALSLATSDTAATETPTTPKAVSLTDPIKAQPTQTGLEHLIVTALKQGQSNEYIDALVNDAATKGNIEVPNTLVTSDGRVDTATLLTTLTIPQDQLANSAANRTYTVQPGDSLASISYRFYGRTDRSADIFDANRGSLTDAGLIEVGQQLVIPAS